MLKSEAMPKYIQLYKFKYTFKFKMDSFVFELRKAKLGFLNILSSLTQTNSKVVRYHSPLVSFSLLHALPFLWQMEGLFLSLESM